MHATFGAVLAPPTGTWNLAGPAIVHLSAQSVPLCHSWRGMKLAKKKVETSGTHCFCFHFFY